LHSNNINNGYLLLEDGATFPGFLPAVTSCSFGEAVFNTSHTGYQEILTDPSYYRQIIIFTQPHIGNTGVNPEDVESAAVQASGMVVRSLAPNPHNQRAKGDLLSYLQDAGVPILTEVNTRAVTLHLRELGAMRAGIFPISVQVEDALDQVKASPMMTGADLAGEVSCKDSYSYSADDLPSEWYPRLESGKGLHVAVLDFGVKRNILRELVSRGCKVTVLPATTPASEIIQGKPRSAGILPASKNLAGEDASATIFQGNYDGILISNGPGDPAAVAYGIKTIRALLMYKMPVFGICLGHQLIALAAGMKTFKLPFGHRGSNHPVRKEDDKTVEITSQNHGFAVSAEHLQEDWRITHINLNDGTIEGLAHTSLPIFSIQYHPEASPGPHEGTTYFDHFIREMRRAKA